MTYSSYWCLLLWAASSGLVSGWDPSALVNQPQTLAAPKDLQVGFRAPVSCKGNCPQGWLAANAHRSLPSHETLKGLHNSGHNSFAQETAFPWLPLLTLATALVVVYTIVVRQGRHVDRQSLPQLPPWAMCHVLTGEFFDWDPNDPKKPFKRGRRSHARLVRHRQKWSGTIRAQARDSASAVDTFAREGTILRFVQMKNELGKLFETCMLKSRVMGFKPKDPVPRRKSEVGRNYSVCYFLLDQNGRPCAPAEADVIPEWKEPIDLTGVPYGIERNKLKKALKRFRSHVGKKLLVRRLSPPLPVYRRWATKVKAELRRLIAYMEVFIKPDKDDNWTTYRGMEDALKKIYDLTEEVRPEGVYHQTLLPWYTPVVQRFKIKEETVPYCNWCHVRRLSKQETAELQKTISALAPIDVETAKAVAQEEEEEEGPWQPQEQEAWEEEQWEEEDKPWKRRGRDSEQYSWNSSGPWRGESY